MYIRPCVKVVKETIRHKKQRTNWELITSKFRFNNPEKMSFATTVKTSVCYNFNSLFVYNMDCRMIS